MSERSQVGLSDDAASAKLRQLKQQQTAMLAQIKQQLSINNAKPSPTAAEAAEQERQRAEELESLLARYREQFGDLPPQ